LRFEIFSSESQSFTRFHSPSVPLSICDDKRDKVFLHESIPLSSSRSIHYPPKFVSLYAGEVFDHIYDKESCFYRSSHDSFETYYKPSLHFLQESKKTADLNLRITPSTDIVSNNQPEKSIIVGCLRNTEMQGSRNAVDKTRPQDESGVFEGTTQRRAVASPRIRNDFLPRLRAETFLFPNRSAEGWHYGVQTHRRDSEAAG
jgi:hypothetical protein